MKFTRELTFDEQRALTPEQEEKYWEWLFQKGEIICRKREREDNDPNPKPWWQLEGEQDDKLAKSLYENWWPAPGDIKKQSGSI